MKELTDRQRDTLSCIEQLTAEKGYPPTIRELSDRLGVSHKGSIYHLRALQQKGLVSRVPNVARSVTLVGSRPQPVAPTPKPEASFPLRDTLLELARTMPVADRKWLAVSLLVFA